MTTREKRRERALFLSAVIMLGTAAEVRVLAQNPAQPETKNLEEIVVTGSRIARRDFSSQTPIVTVDKEAFTSRTAVGLEATLDQLPQFNMAGAGSAASASTASTPFPQANAAPGAATVNLRGLGLNRSLVLIDGRRAPTRQRPARRRLEHDSGGGHRQGRGHHRRRGGGVWRRCDRAAS